jgi:hypothetical protein
MKFADLMSFQKKPQTLNELHAKATAYNALTPKLRTEFLEECEIEAKEFVQKQSESSNQKLQHTYNISIEKLNIQETNIYSEISAAQENHKNALQSRRSAILQQQQQTKNSALSDLNMMGQVPDALAGIQSVNQYNPLTQAFLPRSATSLPFRFLSVLL